MLTLHSFLLISCISCSWPFSNSTGLASLSSTLLAARRELHYLSALSPSTLLPPPPLTSAVVSLGEDVDSPAGSLKGNSSKTHPKESLQSPPQSPTLPQGVRERSVNSSTENESCSQPHRAQTQELVRFTRELLARVFNKVREAFENVHGCYSFLFYLAIVLVHAYFLSVFVKFTLSFPSLSFHPFSFSHLLPLIYL